MTDGDPMTTDDGNGDGLPIDVALQDPDLTNRDQVLALLRDLIEQAHDKAQNGRVRDADNERVRQGWYRTVGYLAGQYRQLVKDQELEEMQEQLKQLKDVTGVE